MVIAVDFDGTIVEDRYPEIGEPRVFAFETLQELQKDRHQLILWTTRTGRYLEEAIQFCKERGVEFYAVNNSYPEEDFSESNGSRKINCELFISSRNLGGMPGWGEVWQEVKQLTEGPSSLYQDNVKMDRSLIGRLKNLFGR